MKLKLVDIGVYLPEGVRRNDAWTEGEQARMLERSRELFEGSAAREHGISEAAQNSFRKAYAPFREDPFQGCQERRIAANGDSSSDLETRATHEVLASAGVDASEIGLLISHTMVPDLLGCNHAARLHERLGLRSDCIAFAVDSMCAAFLTQLSIAEAMGPALGGRYILLTQSSLISHLCPREHVVAAWHGDGATAVLLRCEPSHEPTTLAIESHTDGALSEGLVLGVPGERWYKEGAIQPVVLNRGIAQRLIFQIPDVATTLFERSLRRAGASNDDVGLLVTHQASGWLPPLLRDHLGMQTAALCPTFEWTGTVGSANIPLQLLEAKKQGHLQEGQLIAMLGLGAGVTTASALLRY